VTVPVTTTGANCTKTNDKVCVVKDVNLMHMIQEVQRLTNELADLQRMPVCTDIDVYVGKIKDLMNNIEKTKTMIDTSETKCDPWTKTENIEFAIISDIITEK
jgi:sporulation protein YlmC with PRC-barrel domain